MRIISILKAFWQWQAAAMKATPPYPLTWQEWESLKQLEAKQNPLSAEN